MNRYEVDQIIGMTPCVCGDLETWHWRCYSGKSDAEIENGYRYAYVKARRHIKKMANESALSAIKIATMPHKKPSPDQPR